MSKCKWIGEGEGCDHEAVEGRSYCESHLWRVYEQGSALAKRRKDKRTADNVRTIEQLFDEAVQELEAEGFL